MTGVRLMQARVTISHEGLAADLRSCPATG
jgi:hypothetical protein